MYQPLIPLLLESPRAQSSVPSSYLCTLGPLVLSSLLMACPTTQVSTRISACLRDIQSWMDNHHLKLNPGKAELIFFPALTSPFSDFSISLGEATVSGTSEWWWTTGCPSPRTSQRWPGHAGSSCTTSGESVHSSLPTLLSSSSKQWSCPAWTTATPC